MAYFLDLFSPDTYEAFGRSDRSLSGFRPRQRNAARRIKPGDKLICYMTRLSRFIGVLEVEAGPINDTKPIFYPEHDPFTVRFKVRASVWLPLEKTVPIREDVVWQKLSFTRDLPPSSITWTSKVRGSLRRLSEGDGAFLESLLRQQVSSGKAYPVEPEEYSKLLGH